MFEKFSKNSEFNLENYLVLKLQLVLIGMVAVIFLMPYLNLWVYLGIQMILIAFFLFTLFIQVKKIFKKEFSKFFFLFGLTAIIIQIAWISQLLFKENFELQLNILMALILGLLIVFFAFKLWFGKNYTMGTVLSSNGKITVVKTDFDLMAFSKAGKFLIESNKKFSEGSKVKLALKKGFFSNKPNKIIE